MSRCSFAAEDQNPLLWASNYQVGTPLWVWVAVQVLCHHVNCAVRQEPTAVGLHLSGECAHRVWVVVQVLCYECSCANPMLWASPYQVSMLTGYELQSKFCVMMYLCCGPPPTRAEHSLRIDCSQVLCHDVVVLSGKHLLLGAST